MWTTDKETKDRTFQLNGNFFLTGMKMSATINAGGRIYHVTYCLETGRITRLIAGHDGLTPEPHCKAWDIAHALNPVKMVSRF